MQQNFNLPVTRMSNALNLTASGSGTGRFKFKLPLQVATGSHAGECEGHTAHTHTRKLEDKCRTR
jgi:hypothetical protein